MVKIGYEHEDSQSLVLIDSFIKHIYINCFWRGQGRVFSAVGGDLHNANINITSVTEILKSDGEKCTQPVYTNTVDHI